MTKNSDTRDVQEYQTHTLPQYVYAHFGGKKPTLTKLSHGVWKFSGGGAEVVVAANCAADARTRIKRIVQNINEINGLKSDGRVTRHQH